MVGVRDDWGEGVFRHLGLGSGVLESGFQAFGW